jgi:hypothetical protein
MAIALVLKTSAAKAACRFESYTLRSDAPFQQPPDVAQQLAQARAILG